MNDTDVREQRRLAIGLSALFGAVVVLAMVDLATDWHEGRVHVLVEGTVIVHPGEKGLHFATVDVLDEVSPFTLGHVAPCFKNHCSDDLLNKSHLG